MPKAKISLKVSKHTQKLWREAVNAQKRAYAPYSNYHVGSAFQCGSQIVSGCNVENASYGATVCSERTAIFKAVSQNLRKFSELVVVTPGPTAAPPCALCLQVMSEFCSPSMPIYLATSRQIQKRVLFKELLPGPFRKDFVKRSS